MKAIARRLKKLEDLQAKQRADPEAGLGSIMSERRRKRLIAEGREPEPERPWKYFGGHFMDSSGRISIGDIMLAARRRRLIHWQL